TQRDLVQHVMKARYEALLKTVPEDYRTLLHCESQSHASAWKTAPPKENLMLDHMSFEMIARRSLRVAIIPFPIICPLDGKQVINIYGDHCLHCAPGGHLVFRHND